MGVAVSAVVVVTVGAAVAVDSGVWTAVAAGAAVAVGVRIAVTVGAVIAVVVGSDVSVASGPVVAVGLSTWGSAGEPNESRSHPVRAAKRTRTRPRAINLLVMSAIHHLGSVVSSPRSVSPAG